MNNFVCPACKAAIFRLKKVKVSKKIDYVSINAFGDVIDVGPESEYIDVPYYECHNCDFTHYKIQMFIPD